MSRINTHEFAEKKTYLISILYNFVCVGHRDIFEKKMFKYIKINSDVNCSSYKLDD